MQKLVRDYLNELNRQQKKKRKIGIAVLLLTVLVAGTVVGVLTRYGIAMTGDPKCGIEEHTHTEKCYEDVLVCGLEESEGHTHTEDCYETESVLTCGLEESEPTEESEGHTHTEDCYTEEQKLVCAQEESEGHTHTEECYEEQLVCEKEEHTHTEECYIDKNADVEEASVWDQQYANVEWKEAWGEDLVTVAKAQVGYKESTDNYIVAEDESHKGYTRYGQYAVNAGYEDADVYADWDAAFVNFCLHYAGMEESGMFPAETAAAKWYDEFTKINDGANAAYLTAPEGYEPQEGDIVFMKKENEETAFQMGIVSSYNKEKNEIKVIEGNSGNEVKENQYDAQDEQITAYLKTGELEAAYKDKGENKTSGKEGAAEEEEKSSAYEEKYEDDTIVIHVSAAEGVVPEGAELSVTPIEQKEVTEEMSEEEAAEAEKVNEQYELTNQKLQEESEKKKETLEGFLAYDICFIVDGEEVEPSGDVKVTMDFKEATKPEGVSENAVVAVNHLKEDESAADGIVVEDLTEKDDTTIATAEADAAVEKVELVTDGFSTFVIAWGSDTAKIEVKYVDEEGFVFGEPTSVPQLVLEDGDKVNLKEFLNPPETIENGQCTYKRIRLKYHDKTGAIGNVNYVENISRITYEVFGNDRYLTFDQGSDWGDYVDYASSENIEIQIVYEKKGLTTVETVDSSNLVDIKMIDYSASKNNQYKWSPFDGDTHASDVRSGLLSDKLSDDGYPTFKASSLYDTQNNTSISSTYSLKNLFSGSELKPANHLFIKKEFDATGDYYYNSAETAAVFDKDSGNFTVYNELVVPYYDANSPGYHSGNFLPYNTINNKQRAQDGLPFYLPDGSNIRWDNGEYQGGTAANYHFGMEMSADFLQPKDGLRNASEQPIRYEFDGDDDLWVYIDGVLILDIGGIHPAQSGYIDFSTGEVVVNDQHQYYLKERFEAVLNGATATDADKEKFARMQWNGKTFADYTAHTFKMWYMERGAGASDLKVRFNLPAITKNSINVTKRLQDEHNNYVFNSTEKFGFRVYYKETGEEDYKILTDPASISVPGRESVTIGTGTDGKSGVFTLKPEETATVQLPQQAVYYVEEVDLNTSQYSNNVDIYSTALGMEKKEVEGNNIKSQEATVDLRKALIFTNYKKKAGGPVTEVDFEKKWDDFENIYKTRPKEITVALHGEIQKDGEVIDINNTDSDWMIKNVRKYQKDVTENAKNGKWECKWEELPIYYTNDIYTDKDGNPINYPISWTVKEVGPITPYQAESAIEESSSDSSTKCMSITNKIKVDWQMIKYSSSDTTKTKTLRGAKFALKKDLLSNEILAEGESNDGGIIVWTPTNGETWNTFKEILDGDYIITETQAPEGYVKSGAGWEVKFIKGVPRVNGVENGEYSTNNPIVTIYIPNDILYTLPEAGGSGIYWYMFSGILLMAGAALLTYKKRRKEVLES